MDVIEISNETRVYFKIYEEVDAANKNLPEGVERMDRVERRQTTTAIFIQTGMNGGAKSTASDPLPEKDGYTKRMSEDTKGDKWDGTERVTGGKHYDEKKKLGKQYKDIPNDYLVYIADRNDPKYPNKSQFELDRRTDEDLQEEGSDFPF